MPLSILGLISGIGNAIGIANVQQNSANGVLTLGDFEFQDFEIPSKLDFGAQQQMTIHKLPGGRRVIDIMGNDAKPYAWEGIFLATDAEDRAKQLDQIRQDGNPVPLSFGAFSATVVIQELTFSYERSALIRYKISCAEAPDPDGGDAGSDSLDDGGWVSNLGDASGWLGGDPSFGDVQDTSAGVFDGPGIDL